MPSRRDFIKISAGSLLAMTSQKAFSTDLPENFQQKSEEIIMPKALKAGSKIAITAPASPSSMGEIASGMNFFRRQGCEIVVGDTVRKMQPMQRYFSASDAERTDEFMKFIEDESVDCILTARGGYGVMRILPDLDYGIIRKNAKIIIGFSDITSLLIAIYNHSKMICFHGPVASTTFNQYTNSILSSVLFEKEKYEPVHITSSRAEVITAGVGYGKLVGGNLTKVISSLRTPYEIDTKGAIIFLEENREEPYKIDRMFTQLLLANKFQVASGVVLGNFEYLTVRRNFYPNRSFTTKEVIIERLKPLGIPIIMNLPFGHLKDKATLPYGGLAKIDTDKKTLTLVEQSVEYNYS